MTEGTFVDRLEVVCPRYVQMQDNAPNEIETRDAQTEAIIHTDNVQIHTEIYSKEHLSASSNETNEEYPNASCPLFEHYDEHYMILHSTRSKNIATDDDDVCENTAPIKCVTTTQRQVSKVQAVYSPCDGPQKDSWDEGSRLLSETKKTPETWIPLCHPDCPNLLISRFTQLGQVDEADICFGRIDALTTVRTDKVSMTTNDVATSDTNLATIQEEDSVHWTGIDAETQSAEDAYEEDGFVTDEENVSDAEHDAVSTNTEDPFTIEEVEYSDKGTVVPTESMLQTNLPKRRKKFDSKWQSRAWIIPPTPTRSTKAETRSCARLIRSSSIQLNRECCETRCASAVQCFAASSHCYDEEPGGRSKAEQFCPVDYCAPNSCSTFCRSREPFACDRLRAINNAKRCSSAGETFNNCTWYRYDRNSACNRYYSNFNASHSACTSQYAARSSNCYTPFYYCSVNTWY